MGIVGQLRGGSWALPRPCIFSFLKSGDFPDHTCTKRFLEVKDECCQGMLCPQALQQNPSWQRDVCAHKEDPEISQHGLQNQANQMIGQGKPGRNASIKVIQTAAGCPSVTLSLSPAMYVCPHLQYSLSSKYFTLLHYSYSL